MTLCHLSHEARSHTPDFTELGVHTVLPPQAEAHQLLIMHGKIPSSISCSLRRKRRGTHGEQKSIICSAINSSARYCPLALVFFTPETCNASESSNAWPHSLSYNHWGTGFKGKFDCIPQALQLSFPICFYVVPPIMQLSLGMNIVTRS